MDQYVGKRMGNYDIIELVGKGGMAAVYRAHQPSMNRSVAIKIMAAQYGSDDQFVQRFKNEAQLIAQLEHAHILPVYDFGDEDGVLYIVMRFLSAGTLGDRIPEGGMPIKLAAKYFRQLAAALDYAHSHGIIHRDLKPGNVMIDNQDNIYLTDFGIAKQLQNESNLTGTGGVVGTPTYMSPEQGLGDALDARSDIYALGVILYEMLVGKPPFTADNPMAVMLKHINDAPPSLRTIRDEVTQAIEAVVMRSLAKEQGERYSTALEMADALDEAITTGSVPQIAAGFTDPSFTLSGVKAAASPGVAPHAQTMQSPIAGAPSSTTSELGAVPAGMAVPMPQVAMPTMPEIIPIQLNKVSEWLKKNQWVGTWSQAAMLSVSTFLILIRLTTGAVPEVAVLSLLPGIVYGLLRAPTLGALISMVLVLVPLAARAPALAVLWTALLVVAGSRLNSREIMLTLVTIVAAGSPLGWLVPLLAPWWLKARRTVLPVAIGAAYATLFAITLGWPSAGRLLPVPTDIADLSEGATLGGFDTTYFGLMEPDTWSAWLTNPSEVVEGMRATFTALGGAFAETGGLPLVVATAWALAAVLSVSNQHSEQAPLRALGIALGLGILLVAHLVLRASVAMPNPTVPALVMGVAAAALTFLFSQWPITADPNLGNKIGTLLRMLRNAMGALFMALGVAYFARYLQGQASPFYVVFLLGGIAGTLTMITNPMLGPPIVFTSLVVALLPIDPVLAGVVGALLLGYLVVNLLFDKRRPRNWNPLGAGFILGSPGMALAGIMPLGPLAIGALEAQVPAAILATMGHVLLIATAEDIVPFAIIVQLVTTLFGVLLVERLMATPALDMLHPRLRRLAFTGALALIMAVSYYGLGRVETKVGDLAPLGVAVVVSVISAAALVASMGKRAEFWREFVEKEESEAEEFEDEEVTGVTGKQKAATATK